MVLAVSVDGRLDVAACQRALEARDPRFDGLFFVAITTTRIYCRPICPARVTYPERRRFFRSAAEAERAGYRPCLRCRPELAPGRSACDAVSQLACAASDRIAAGALNGRGVHDLARDLSVSERHLRRALERELGVSPVELAQTHRLLLAKQLLADTDLPVTRIAFASGFQSLRRLNAAFRERYRMPPTALRRSRRAAGTARGDAAADALRLTLSYRAPLAWDELLAFLGRHATPGVELVAGRRYGRTVELNGHRGVLFVEDTAWAARVDVEVSSTLVPVLMPLLARVRQLLDLDAEPSVIDAHLQAGDLGALVRTRPGLRAPGAIDGFEAALRVLLDDVAGTAGAAGLAGRVAHALGEPIESGVPALTRLAPGADRVAEAGAPTLAGLGVPRQRADAIAAAGRAVADGTLRLELGGDVEATERALVETCGIAEGEAAAIVLRALHWPDAFPAADRTLQRAAGVSSEQALRERAERWRPWRAYAAHHLWLDGAATGDS